MNGIVTNPTEKDISDAGKWFDAEFCYCEGAMTRLFGAFPENIDVHIVYLKVVALNALYSTQIPLYDARVPTLWEMADHIVCLKIDNALMEGDSGLVHKIAETIVEAKKRRYNYSFATKFCSWQRPSAYPIFDSRVSEYLWHLKKLGAIPISKRDDLWDYPVFKGIVDEFRVHFGLEGISYKEIDKFLYREGGKLLDSANRPSELPG